MSDAKLDDPPLTWTRTFPGTPDQVRQARRFLAAILNGHPVTDNASACLSELASNAVIHSRSAMPGGTFTVRMRRSGARIRIEVTDDGGRWGEPPDDPEHGRGLFVVGLLSAERGITLRGPRNDPCERTVWFEMALT